MVNVLDQSWDTIELCCFETDQKYLCCQMLIILPFSDCAKSPTAWISLALLHYDAFVQGARLNSLLVVKEKLSWLILDLFHVELYL